MAETKKYYHQLTDEEISKLVEDKKTWQYVMDNYLQPDWCNYFNALAGKMGCWSLTDNSKGGLRHKISTDYCRSCDCFQPIKKML